MAPARAYPNTPVSELESAVAGASALSRVDEFISEIGIGEGALDYYEAERSAEGEDDCAELLIADLVPPHCGAGFAVRVRGSEELVTVGSPGKVLGVGLGV